MKEIVPKDTRYIPFTQQHSCCVPTCISIIMYKLGIPLIPTELLGYHLGLIVNKKNKHLFWNARTGNKPATGYGTQIYKKRFEINSVFKKLKIPIKISAYSLTDFLTKKELIAYVGNCVNRNKNLIVLLNSDVLNNTNNNNGHACVIDRIYPQKQTIRLIDPQPLQTKWREISINKFIRAMKLHPTRQGRLLELEKI